MKLTVFGRLFLFLVGLALAATAFYRFVPAERRDALLARVGFAPRTVPQAGGEAAPPRQGTSTAVAPRLRLAGSNTIGGDLAPALAEAFLRRQGATTVARRPLAADEVVVAGMLPGSSAEVAIEIAAHGSTTAFERLAAGQAEIGMASRRIRPEESAKLAELGEMTAASNEHILGLDGIAIVVNRANPVDHLPLETLRDLFSGRLTDWAQAGGSAGPIRLYARDERSGTFDTFKQLVLESRPLPAVAERYEDSRKLAAAVAADSGGIGFVGLAYVGEAKALKISEAGSVPYRPTVFTVRTEDYLLSRRLYLYTPAQPREPWVRQFVDFALSNEGQAIVDAIGFAGQSLSGSAPAEAAADRGELPPEYVRVTRGAARLPLAFRFESGSDRLDNKALRDIGRLLETLSQPANRDKRVLLLGFADGRGTPEVNLRLSQARAGAIARELESEGVRSAEVAGFGAALAVASNESEEGRRRNRRVEIWLR